MENMDMKKAQPMIFHFHNVKNKLIYGQELHLGQPESEEDFGKVVSEFTYFHEFLEKTYRLLPFS